MATYVIGDIHGCRRTLDELLSQLPIDQASDSLWTTGDLVNRGNDSLGVLRWAREQSGRFGDRFQSVLGNHDLHLLACAVDIQDPAKRPALHQVLDAPDAAELLELVRDLPLAVEGEQGLLVHAGLLPSWSRESTLAKARRVARRLGGAHGELLLHRSPSDWESLALDRDLPSSLRQDLESEHHDLEVFTRTRCLRKRRGRQADRDGSSGALDEAFELVDFGGAPNEAPARTQPWFALDAEWRASTPVVFGHWAALGLHLADHVIGLDSGCSWGNRLTAIRLEDRRLFQSPLVADDLRP